MFEKIVGNDEMKETLARLRAAGRFPGASLFAGPEGVGKKLFALEMAKSFVCRVSDTSACGECPACVRAGHVEMPSADDKEAFEKIIFTDHPDVGLVAAKNRFILVHAIRHLESEAHFRPFEAAARTFIIDNADKMNDEASNALLKTLEEPASTSRIILISSRPDALLSTIRSRCQTFRFAPVRAEQIAKLLIEQKNIPEPDARLAARSAEGSVGRAMAIDAAELRSRRADLMSALRNALVRHDRASLMRSSEKLAEAKNKEFFERDLELLSTLIRDVWAVSIDANESSVVHADILADLYELSEAADRRKLVGLIHEIELIRERLAVNLNRKFAADDLFLKMAA